MRQVGVVLARGLLQRSVAEAVGTFALVFAGCGSIMVAERFPGKIPNGAVPVVFGLIVAAMIYAVGHISGAHFNPAVTLAFAVVRHFPKREVFFYWLAQCLGSLIAIFLLIAILPKGSSFGATSPQVSSWMAVAWETVLTFFLMFVIIAVATDTRAEGTMAGAAIGATVMLAAFVGGPVTGASLNPARSLAPAILESRMDVLWIYVVGPMLGAVIAAKLYTWIRNEGGAGKVSKCPRSNSEEDGRMVQITPITTVLFACIHNAGRSQIAASFFNLFADPDKATAISAGTEPADKVHREVVEVMREIGVDLSQAKPQRLTDELARRVQMLITMGCGEACPVVPGVFRDDWQISDPKNQSRDRVREIRDDLSKRVRQLIQTRGWEKHPNGA